MDLLLLLSMLLVSQKISGKLRMKCPLNMVHLDRERPWSYYRPGDHLIGIVTSAVTQNQKILFFNQLPYNQSFFESYTSKGIERFIFTIQVINKNIQLLCNLTLGYNIHDNYLKALGTSEVLLEMLSTGEANVPNYSCGRKDNILALLDAADREVSIQMSTLVGLYKVPQMLLKEGFLYSAIVQVLLHFRWTLIGLLAPDTDEGEKFLRTFPPLLVRNGICVVISQQFTTSGYPVPFRDSSFSHWKQVNVFVHYTEHVIVSNTFHTFHLTLDILSGPIREKVWITTTLGNYLMSHLEYHKYIHSIWSFEFMQEIRPEYGDFEPFSFIDSQYEDKNFQCSFSKHVFSVKGRKRCTQKSAVETENELNGIFIENSDSVYSIFMTLAHVLKAAYSSRSWRRRKEAQETLEAPRLQPWKVWGPNKDVTNTIPLEKESFREREESYQPPCATKGQQIWPI